MSHNRELLGPVGRVGIGENLDTGEVLGSWRERLATLFAEAGRQRRRARVATSLLAACEDAVILARAEPPFELVAAEQLAMIAAASERWPDPPRLAPC